jgi:hypothetical protein
MGIWTFATHGRDAEIEVSASHVVQAVAAANEPTARATEPQALKNVIFSSSAGQQDVDLDAEYARAAATEQSA